MSAPPTAEAAERLLAGRGVDPLDLLTLEVTRFLVWEAQLLDERRFEEWLALFSPAIRYWAPVRMTREGFDDVVDDDGLCHFDDDHMTLRLRIASLCSKSAWAEIPRSRTRRLITNVAVETVEDDHCVVRSSFLVYRGRLADIENQFVGYRHDRLERGDDGWLIAERRIVLDNVMLKADNISIML